MNGYLCFWCFYPVGFESAIMPSYTPTICGQRTRPSNLTLGVCYSAPRLPPAGYVSLECLVAHHAVTASRIAGEDSPPCLDPESEGIIAVPAARFALRTKNLRTAVFESSSRDLRWQDSIR